MGLSRSEARQSFVCRECSVPTPRGTTSGELLQQPNCMGKAEQALVEDDAQDESHLSDQLQKRQIAAILCVTHASASCSWPCVLQLQHMALCMLACHHISSDPDS